MKFRHFLFISLMTALLLVACSRHAKKTASTGEGYLKLAQTASVDEKPDYQIKAADTFLNQQKPTEAEQVLTTLNDESLTPQQTAQADLVEAKTFLINGKISKAITLLHQVADHSDILTDNQQKLLHSMLANAYEASGDTANSIVERSQLQRFLNNSNEQTQNLEATWASLQSLPTRKLNTLFNASPSANLRGWVALAVITKTINDPNTLKVAIDQWKSDYPNHPALAVLPKTLDKNNDKTTVVATQRKNVALLLPLHGRYAAVGRAIRNGFLAAYYYDKKNNPFSNTQIAIYDTTKSNIIALYQAATAKGATTIVGPLLKNHLQTLIDSDEINKPTIALNTLPKLDNDNPNLFQFGLSPIDEATQTATAALKNGYRHVIIIAKNSPWSNDIVDTFLSKWQAGNGKVTDTMQYSNDSDLNQRMSDVLGVTLAQKDFKQLHHYIGYKIRFLPRRRKDVDMIYLVAQPNVARQVMPLTKFYYAGNLPVYTTSQAYTSKLSRQARQDMNGIIFPEMPWIVTPGNMSANLKAIRQQIRVVWPVSFSRHQKMYALGVDAFNLVGELHNMQTIAQFSYPGATGKLSLDKNRHLYRSLLWTQLVRNKPKRL